MDVIGLRRGQQFIIAIVLLLALGFWEVNHSVSQRPLSIVSSEAAEQDQWLLATISPALAQLRRNMIRTTWQQRYTGPPATMRFILANPGEEWMPLIEAENKTYNDLVMLSHLTEGKSLGMRTKEIEFMHWLAHSGMSWQYVSKLDDDSYLDASAFHREYLKPQLQSNSMNGTMIARRLGNNRRFAFPYPGGQFYTISWNLVVAISNAFVTNKASEDYADVLIGRLLYEAHEPYNFVTLDNSKAFDFKADNGNKGDWSHNITEGSINPHQLKDDAVFMRVAGDMLDLLAA